MSKWFSAHAHSEFSILDATSNVPAMVGKAHRLGQPAAVLTDHGNMGGTIQLYRAGQKYNMPVFPGVEGYLCINPIDDSKESGKQERYHIGLIALNFEGYKALIKFVSMTHTRPRFNRFPRFDLNDLALLGKEAGENIALTTGCFFGLVQQTLIEKGPSAAKRIIAMYASWFPHTFVEIQNHNIDHAEQMPDEGGWKKNLFTDDAICNALYGMAVELGLPVLVTQDSHYLDQKEKTAHNLMKRMVYGGEGTENEFPGDSFHVASAQWVKEHHQKKHWKAGIEGCERLLDIHDLTLPALENYKIHTPSTKKNPQRWLEKATRKALDELESLGRLKKPRKQYDKRLDHELDTIEFLGQAGYFSIWDEFMKWAESENICVEARGSANGSLVCYLLGITQIDPLQWGLLFERFLSRDRKKSPDVDMDIEDERRPEAVAVLAKMFGVEQIGTYQALGARETDDKGNILVTYNSYLRRKLGNEVFVPKYGRGLESINDVRKISNADYQGLRQLSKLSVKRSYGVHPAGLLLSGDDQKISDYVPTMLVASSNTRVTQFNMDDVEELGNLKMDILGQRTLTIMRRCQELIGRENPRDFSWIPLDDKATCRMLSKVQPDSAIFQFEGYSMAKGARVMKIRNTNDCVLAGALFRPACMDSGMTDKYIDRRFNKELRNVDHPHPAFEEILKPTYGIVLFQEQVLAIMRRLGLDYEGINTFFKIVKDSGKGATARNKERAKEVQKTWKDLCDRNGITDPDWAWEYIEGYMSYGFNKAHSTGYGVRSYRCAYLKTHYPLEFMTAVLESNAGRQKEPLYIKETRRLGMHILSPDVNVSGANWTIDRKRGGIRKGLASIKGIGHPAAIDIEANAPYKDIEDLLESCEPRTVSGKPKFLKEGEWSGNLLKLKDAGALKSLGIGREDWDD